MKINSNLVIEIATIFIVIAIVFIMLAQVGTLNVNTPGNETHYLLLESFEDDTSGLNPNGNDSDGSPYTVFYDYDEEDWGPSPATWNDNVTDTESYFAGSNSFWCYGNNSGAESEFYFLDHNGDEFCADWGIEIIGFAFQINNQTNDGTDFEFYDCSPALMFYIDILTNQSGDGDTWFIMKDGSGTEMLNYTVDNMTWYGWTCAIDWSGTGAPEFTSTLWAADLAGLWTVPLDTNTTTLATGKLWFMLEQPWRAGQYGNCYVDDLFIQYTVPSDSTQGLNDLTGVWAFLVGIIVIAVIISVLWLLITQMKAKK